MRTSQRSATGIAPEAASSREAIDLLGCVVALLLAAGAQPQQAAARPAPVALRLSAVATHIEAYEPVRLLLEAEVVAPEGLQGWLSVNPKGENTWLEVSGPAGTHKYRFLHFLGPRGVVAGYAPPKCVLYQTGYVASTESWVVYDFSACQFIFAAAGSYKLTASLQYFLGKTFDPHHSAQVECSPITISVTAPSDRLLPRLWAWPPQAVMFANGEDTFAYLVKEPADSSYACYARYALSGNEALVPAERIRLLKEIVEGKPPVQLLDLALLRLAELLDETQDYAGCKQCAARVLELETAPEWSKKAASELAQKADRLLGK